MKKLLRSILIAVGAAFILGQLQIVLGSNHILKFLDQNLVSLLIALLAINTASLGIILSKIRELADSSNRNNDFLKTQKEMLFSVKEQIVLIFLSLLLLLINDSKWLQIHSSLVTLVETSIISCFVYGMLILYDTANSVFIILNYRKST